MLRRLRRRSGVLARPAGGASFTARASAPSRVARTSDMVAFGAIEGCVPVGAFVFAFRLSMECEGFLLCPHRGVVRRVRNNDDDVANGVQRSRPITTSAA